MAGLLDFLSTPTGQGLLGAVAGGMAGARRGQPINSIGRGLLAGTASYAQGLDRQQQEQQLSVMNQYRDMQMKGLQSEIARTEREAAEKARINKLVADTFLPVTGTTANQVTGIVGPRPEAAQAIGTVPPVDYQRLIALGVPTERVKGLAEARNYGRDKVARTAEVEGPNGTKRIVQLDDYGQEVGPGMSGYVAPVLVDQGDKKVFAKPNAGQAFQVGMSPAEVAANARGWADIQTKRDANDINRTAARTQIVEGADGNVYLVDKGTGLSRPTATLGGTQIRAGKAAEAGMTRTRDANDSLELVGIARQLLPGATGSGIGAAADATGRFFGMSSEGAQKAAQLEAIGGQLVMKMPRMEGPQSNMDQLLYREMAGKVGDRTVPVQEREAALKVVERLNMKYANAQPKQDQAAPNGKTVSRTGMLNGRKVVEYSDGSVSYAD